MPSKKVAPLWYLPWPAHCTPLALRKMRAPPKLHQCKDSSGVSMIRRLNSNTAAVNLQMSPGHELTILAHQKGNDASDIVRAAEALQGSFLLELG